MSTSPRPQLPELARSLREIGYARNTVERWARHRRRIEGQWTPLSRRADEVTVARAAAELGVHSNTIRRWCDQKRIVSRRTLSGYRLIPQSEVRRLRADRPTSPP